MFESDWEAGVPTITVAQDSEPYSNKMTKFKLNIDLAGVDPQTVRRVQVLSTFKFELREILNLDMVGMLHTVSETPAGAGKVSMNGYLRFDQDEAILVDNVKRVLFDDDPILSDYSAFSLSEILENYQHRKGKFTPFDINTNTLERLNFDYQ